MFDDFDAHWFDEPPGGFYGYIDDPDGDAEYYDCPERPPRKVTCNRCKKRGLSWRNGGDKWRLLEPSGEFHVCEHRPKPVDPAKQVLSIPEEWFK